MCRNIRVLHHFQPPSTPEEIRAAALQYVRKVSGLRTPAKADIDEVERAVEAVMRATTRLLEKLPLRGDARTREGEKERARQRWATREARIIGTPAKSAAHAKPARSTKSAKSVKSSVKAAQSVRPSSSEKGLSSR